MEGGKKVIVTPHMHERVFMITKGRDCTILTKSLVPGETVYNEERLSVQNEDATEVKYRVWDPFLSDLAAAVIGILTTFGSNMVLKFFTLVLLLEPLSLMFLILLDMRDVFVLYIEISKRSGRELVKMAKTRPNVITIFEDSRNPAKYKMLGSMVDVICADLAQPHEDMVLALNASFFLKTGGHFFMMIYANIHRLTMQPEEVYSNELKKLLADELRPSEQVTLES